MTYKYRSRFKSRKIASKSKRNFFISLFLIILVMYAGLIWGLPLLINGVSTVKNYAQPIKTTTVEGPTTSSLAPPVLNIPYEATNTAQINITGYGTTNSKVSIYLDDDKKDTVDVSSDGTFEFKDIALVLGTNNIYGKSIDEKDKESLPSKTLKVLFDNEKPLLKITEPEDNKKIQGGDKKVKIAGNTEAGSQVFINNNQVIVDKDGNFSSDLELHDGDNNFNIKATDIATNSTEVSRNVNYTP